MKRTRMYQLIVLLTALLGGVLGAHAQVAKLADQHLYRDNSGAITSPVLPPGDQLLTPSAVLYDYTMNLELKPTLQPVVTLTGGAISATWSAAQSQALPEIAFLQLRLGNVTRFVATVRINKNAVPVTPTPIVPVAGTTIQDFLTLLLGIGNAPVTAQPDQLIQDFYAQLLTIY